MSYLPEQADQKAGQGASSVAGIPAMKLTVKQAAERAGVSPALVYEWCEERRLPHYRAGRQGRRGKILIEEADLDAFIESLKVEPPDDPAEAAYQRHLR